MKGDTTYHANIWTGLYVLFAFHEDRYAPRGVYLPPKRPELFDNYVVILFVGMKPGFFLDMLAVVSPEGVLPL